MKNKIILTFVIIVLTTVILNIHSVLGVGIVSQGWMEDIDGDGENELIYRTFATPYYTTVQNYANLRVDDDNIIEDATYSYGGKNRTSHWVYTFESPSYTIPGVGQYTVIGRNFHSQKLSSYTTSGSLAYNKVNSGSSVNSSIDSIKTVVNGSSKQQTSIPSNEYIVSWNNSKFVTSGEDKIYHTVLGVQGNFAGIESELGTKLQFNISDLQQKSLEYRYAIINFQGNNIYISDNIIYSSALKEIINQGATKGCYVSDIIISGSYIDGIRYEAAVTPNAFFSQYNKQITFWSDSTRGQTDKALGSVLNLFDNEIKFPQSSERKVVIRHILLDDNSKEVSKPYVHNGQLIKPNNLTLEVYTAGTRGSKSTTWVTDHEEFAINVDQGIRKTSSTSEDYWCVGYNTSIQPSLSEALDEISIKVNENQYTASSQKTAVVDISPAGPVSDANYIVIEFYYSTSGEEVHANHIYVDTNGKILDKDRQTISPDSSTATIDGERINKINNQDTYIKAVYLRKLNSDLKITPASNTSGTYIGYELLEKVETIDFGEKITSKLTSGDATLSSNQYKQVNFYYELQGQAAPIKEIGGKLFVSGEKNNGICYDEEERYSTTSVPSGENATVGVKDISRYMMGAIAEDYSTEENSKKITVTFKMGNYTKSYTYTINYEAEYYKITDMALYKLASVVVYDAGRAGTKGTSIFNWDSKDVVKSLNMNTEIELTGVNGSINSQDADDVNDIDNYIKLNLTDNLANIDINKDFTATGDGTITATYFTETKFNQIDANNDGVINYDDVEAAKQNYEYWKEVASSQAKDCTDLQATADNCSTAACNDDPNSVDCNNAIWLCEGLQEYASRCWESYDDYAQRRDDAKSIYNDLNSNIDTYIAKYNEYMALDESVGNKLNVSVKVQNMDVKINDQTILKYTNGSATKTVSQPLSLAKTIKISTGKPTIDKTIYDEGIQNIAADDYTKGNAGQIPTTILNGVRHLAGQVKYEASVVIGESQLDQILDNVYYGNNSLNNTFKITAATLSKYYEVNNEATASNEKYASVEPINIYTPITVNASVGEIGEIIDQTTNGQLTGVSVIQLNTPFTITLGNNIPDSIYNNTTGAYAYLGNYGYYIKFDFDVHKVSINGRTYKNGDRIPAGTWIGLIKGKSNITVQAYSNLEDETLSIVSEENSNYTVRAVAYNVTTLMLNKSTRYKSLSQMATAEKDLIYNICDDSGYFDEEEYGVAIINRAYDFRVTDVKDLSWKDIFRKNTYAHTGIAYYAGTRKWDTTSDENNKLVGRTTLEVGKNPSRTLPIGPYKNTNITYTNAPKLGYRFSYDMKVTGSYYNSNGNPRTNKKVNIKTSFYYVSKDGKTYLPEYAGTGTGIYLFYKNSQGKYVRIDENGGGYNLTFTPNDGYRLIRDSNTSTLATKSVSLGNLREITLNYQMATASNNGATITYYGEYKLPNSTIAVKVKNGKYDINNPLKDGYIGVVFNIVAYSGTVNIKNVSKDVLLSYSKDTDGTNTSQWDYEGFLGFTNHGKQVSSLALKLEKGNWNITNSIYNQIKGSVILYDTDQRAATDYE